MCVHLLKVRLGPAPALVQPGTAYLTPLSANYQHGKKGSLDNEHIFGGYVWYHPSAPNKKRRKQGELPRFNFIAGHYGANCCHNVCRNDECEAYAQTGVRNMVSNLFELCQTKKKGSASDAASTASQCVALPTTKCSLCGGTAGLVEACTGRMHAEIVLKTDGTKELLGENCTGVSIVYFLGNHICLTEQDASKRHGKDQMRQHASSVEQSTPSKLEHDSINEFLVQLAATTTEEEACAIMAQLEACMPALVDEKAVRQEHHASAKDMGGDMARGVAGVEQLRAGMELAGVEMFRSSPRTGNLAIMESDEVDSKQRWLLLGNAGADLLRRMQPGGDLEKSELCFDDVHSIISNRDWHATVGTMWDPRTRRMWVVYVAYKRGQKAMDYQVVWRDLCTAHGSVLRLGSPVDDLSIDILQIGFENKFGSHWLL